MPLRCKTLVGGPGRPDTRVRGSPFSPRPVLIDRVGMRRALHRSNPHWVWKWRGGCVGAPAGVLGPREVRPRGAGVYVYAWRKQEEKPSRVSRIPAKWKTLRFTV